MALNQQGASWLNKIQVWKILEDQSDAVTPSGVVFLSRLNVCVSATGLVLCGASSRWEVVLQLGFGGYNLSYYNLLWSKWCWWHFFAAHFLVLKATQYSITTSNLPRKTEDVLPLNSPLEGIIFLVLKTLITNHSKEKDIPSSSKCPTQWPPVISNNALSDYKSLQDTLTVPFPQMSSYWRILEGPNTKSQHFKKCFP